MSVWDSIVGQKPVVDLLSRTAASDSSAIAQSWLLCGPPGSGRSNVARAFAAALECPNHGCGECSVCRHILAGTHPDVTVVTTDRVTISIDQVRSLIDTAEQTPTTAAWRIIIIEDVDRMMERTTNVLLKEIEEPSEHTIWLLCAPSAQDVLPTIRSRTRIVNLAVPSATAVTQFLENTLSIDHSVAARSARLAQGHIGIARLYATDEQAVTDRDELVVGVLNLRKASDAVLLAAMLVDNANTQANHDIEQTVEREQKQFREINGLSEKDKIPAALRSQYNAIGKKDDVRRRTTRRSRDVIDRGLTSIASVYRDISVMQNHAEDVAGIVNLENRTAIAELAAQISRERAIECNNSISVARRRLAGNGNQLLVLEALFASLV